MDIGIDTMKYDNIPQKYIDKLQRHETIVDMTLKLWKTKKREA
jgi:hypothetical protein